MSYLFRIRELLVPGRAWGRNGIFKARRVDVARLVPSEVGDDVRIEVWSRNQRGDPPIELALCPQDAIEIGRTLVAAGMGIRPDG